MRGVQETFAAVGAVGGIAGPTVAVYVAFRLQQVHRLVNAHASTQEDLIGQQGARIDQLAGALVTGGVDVPATTQKTGPA